MARSAFPTTADIVLALRSSGVCSLAMDESSCGGGSFRTSLFVYADGAVHSSKVRFRTDNFHDAGSGTTASDLSYTIAAVVELSDGTFDAHASSPQHCSHGRFL